MRTQDMYTFCALTCFSLTTVRLPELKSRRIKASRLFLVGTHALRPIQSSCINVTSMSSPKRKLGRSVEAHFSYFRFICATLSIIYLRRVFISPRRTVDRHILQKLVDNIDWIQVVIRFHNVDHFHLCVLGSEARSFGVPPP